MTAELYTVIAVQVKTENCFS